MFTANAMSMYTNIDTHQALHTIRIYLWSHVKDFNRVPIESLMAALRIVMLNNIFEFGNMIWKQLLAEYEQPTIDASLDEALRAFVARRKEEIQAM